MQTGALVYVTSADASPSGQTIDVTTVGYYYFNGTQWVLASGNDWHTTGNLGTIPGTNFLGTTDNQALMFKVNNIKSGYIDNLTAEGNTGIGYNTMTGSSFSTAGAAKSNIALGANTLSSATSATTWSNIAIGNNALRNATDPRFNTAIGDGSQVNLTTGRNNVSIGVGTLSNATTGGINTVIGGSALGSLTTGNANSSVGLASLPSVTTGSNNIALGYLVGSNITTGSYNIVFGSNEMVPDGSKSGQLNIGGLIRGTGVSTGIRKVGIAIGNVDPNSTLELNGSFSAPIRKGSGAVSDTDYTLLGSGNFTLPNPVGLVGRIYNFVYDGTDFSVTGSLRLDGNVITSYGINNTGSLKRITVQSDGTNWVILY